MKKYILLSIMVLASGINLVAMEPQKSCDVCLEDKSTYDFIKPLSCCAHDASCADCLIDLINTSLQEKTIANIKCPNRHCAQQINDQDIQALNPDLFKLFCETATHEYMNNDESIKHCPAPDCSFAFINDQENQQSFTCPNCNSNYCSNCLVQHAMHMTCEQAREDLKITGNKTKAEQAAEKWKRECSKKCPRCKANIEKNNGCNHMTCKCQYEFCWVCLSRWRTCSCPHFPANQNNNRVGNEHIAGRQQQEQLRLEQARQEEQQRLQRLEQERQEELRREQERRREENDKIKRRVEIESYFKSEEYRQESFREDRYREERKRQKEQQQWLREQQEKQKKEIEQLERWQREDQEWQQQKAQEEQQRLEKERKEKETSCIVQ